MKSDFTTFDLGQTCLRLKDGLNFLIQQGRHGCWYLIEDDSRGRFYRIGATEYTFVSLLDGKTSLSSAMATTCSLLGAKALGEQDAINLCKWLVDSGLANTRSSTSTDTLRERQATRAAQLNIQKLNPISIRIPLWDLDDFTQAASRYFGWVISWPVAVIWLVICVYGLLSLAIAWDRLSTVDVFSRNNLAWMIATWIVLKSIHEFAHVLVCKTFGGKIGKGGILFLLLIPMPFVDVTSSWRFPNKYQRILTAAAGMFAEIFLAAVAAIVWANTSPGTLNFHAANVMVAASLHTVLFNANPLMRFDGYHILADWLELPNLGNHGQSYVKSVFQNWFFGNEIKPIQYAGFHEQIIKIYGFAALAWKVLLCFVLTIAASNLFDGIGLLVALVAGILWLGLPAANLLKFLIFGGDYEIPNRRRFVKVSAGIATAMIALMCLVPAPSVINAPVVIEYRPLSIIRAETPGFIDAILVNDQQLVEEGQLLVQLRNQELDVQLNQTMAELQKSTIRARSFKNDGDIGMWQVENATIQALRKQLTEYEDQKSDLEIRSPITGRVIARRLGDDLGMYVAAGTELLSVGNESNKEAIALISQNDARIAADTHGTRVDLRIWGQERLLPARMDRITPRTRDDLPHFSFAGIYGGPLDVLQRSQIENTDEQNDDRLMLSQPRVQAKLRLDPMTSQSVRAGEVGLAHIRGRNQKLGGYLIDQTTRWLKHQITESHGL